MQKSHPASAGRSVSVSSFVSPLATVNGVWKTTREISTADVPATGAHRGSGELHKAGPRENRLPTAQRVLIQQPLPLPAKRRDKYHIAGVFPATVEPGVNGVR